MLFDYLNELIDCKLELRRTESVPTFLDVRQV